MLEPMWITAAGRRFLIAVEGLQAWSTFLANWTWRWSRLRVLLELHQPDLTNQLSESWIAADRVEI
jgi:hypothetical protein